MKATIKILYIVWLCAGLSGLLLCQSGRGKGRILGTVRNEGGNPIEGVKITAVHQESSTTFQTKSDKKGIWSILGLGTGNWKITAEHADYISLSTDQNVKQLGENPALDFVLKKAQKQTGGLEDQASIQLLEDGNRLFEEKKYDDALALFSQFLEKNPKFYQIHINIGNCHKEKGDYARALEEFATTLEAVKQEGPSPAANSIAAGANASIGEVYIKQNDLVSAQKYLTEAMTLNPENEDIAYLVGEIYFSNNNADKALEYFAQAIRINPASAKSYLKLGYVYLNKADYKASIDSFKKFLELDPSSAQAATVQNLIVQIEKLKKE